MVLRGIHVNVDIYQTDYNIPLKLEFSPYPEAIHGYTTFKLKKCWQRLKENDHLFNSLFSFFHFLHSNIPDNKCHKQKWRMLFFYTHQTSGTCAGVCACNRTHQMNKTEIYPPPPTAIQNISK